VKAEDGPQVFERAFVAEARRALVGMELPVRLDDGHVHLSPAQGRQIEDRSVRRLHRAPDVVLDAGFVDEPADGPSRRIIKAGDHARSDGDEARLLRHGGAWGKRGCGHGCQGERHAQDGGFHQDLFSMAWTRRCSRRWERHGEQTHEIKNSS
jgi:hypothetical protein